MHRNLEYYVHESRQTGSGQTRDGKSEHQHFRNQRTKRTQMTIISTTKGKNPLEKWSSPHTQQNSQKNSIWMQSQKRQNDLCSFPRQTIQYHTNPSLFQPVMRK